MKRIMAVIISVLSITLTFSNSANAESPSKKFKNCTELRKVFPKGVAKDVKSAGISGATVNAKVYRENIASDRDKDGIACETA